MGVGALVPYEDGIVMRKGEKNHKDEQRTDGVSISIMSFMSIAIPSLHFPSIMHLIQRTTAALLSSTIYS